MNQDHIEDSQDFAQFGRDEIPVDNRNGDLASLDEIRRVVLRYQPRSIPPEIYARHYRVEIAQLVMAKATRSKNYAIDLAAYLAGFVAWCRDEPTVDHHGKSVVDLLQLQTIEDYVGSAQASRRMTPSSGTVIRWALRRLAEGQIVGSRPAISGVGHPGRKQDRPPRTIEDLTCLVDDVIDAGVPLWAAVLAATLVGDTSLPADEVRVGDVSTTPLPPRFDRMRRRLMALFDHDTVICRHHWYTLTNQFLKGRPLHFQTVLRLRQIDWLESSIPTAVCALSSVTYSELPPRDRLVGDFGDPTRFAGILDVLPR